MPSIDPARVKSTVRTAIYTGTIAGAHAVRATSPLVRKVAPGVADRIDQSNFLQQPTHGKWWQERFYNKSEDPYGFASSDYEAGKYADTLEVIAAQHPEPIRRALEVGSAQGVFTAQLAGVAEQVVGVEISETACDRARAALVDHPNVTIELSSLPAQMPSGTFDVIVASDVLYYFPSDVLTGLLKKFEQALEPGGVFVSVHYLGNFGARKGGPLVHATQDRVLTIPRVFDETRSGIGPDGISGYRVSAYRRPA